MLFRCFLTKMVWILCKLKNWGLPWPLWVLFTLLLAAGLVFLYCKSCASRLEKGLLKAGGGLNSLTCIKFIIFLLKNTSEYWSEVNLSPFSDYNVCWNKHAVFILKTLQTDFPIVGRFLCNLLEKKQKNKVEIYSSWGWWLCSLASLQPQPLPRLRLRPRKQAGYMLPLWWPLLRPLRLLRLSTSLVV